MFKKIVHKLLKHRHFWREADFSEISEIYVSLMFRSLALSLTGIFVPVYLYKLGYGVEGVIVTVLAYFVFRAVLFDILAGILTARFGPKHTILSSYFLLILSTILFLTLPALAWPLWLVGGIWGGTSSLFCIPLHVDFSKIKHKDHAGKEIGFLKIVEKSGGVIGPLVGGVVATLFGGQYIFLVAMILLVVGGWPLLKTAEPVKTRQHFSLKGLPLKKIRRDLFSFMPFGVELTITGSIWPLYLTLFVLTTATTYAELGVLTSISVVASMLAAYSVGKLIDKRRGRRLLRFGASANTILSLLRPLITTHPGALLVNLTNEQVTMAYHLPYVKGMYDAGDELPGHRIAYFVLMELVSSSAKALAWAVLLVLAMHVSDYTVLTVGFGIGAVCSLLIMIEKFPALSTKSL